MSVTQDYFVARMIELRISRDYSQRGFVEELNRRGLAWFQTTLSKVEKGQRALSLDEAVVIAEALKVPIGGMLPLTATDWAESASLAAQQRKLLHGALDEVQHALDDVNAVVAAQRHRSTMTYHTGTFPDPDAEIELDADDDEKD